MASVLEPIVFDAATFRRELNAFEDPDAQSVHDGLESFFDRFPSLDFAALTHAADQAAYDREFAKTQQSLAEWKRLVKADPSIQAIDANPFATTNVAATLSDSLGEISRELQIA